MLPTRICDCNNRPYAAIIVKDTEKTWIYVTLLGDLGGNGENSCLSKCSICYVGFKAIFRSMVKGIAKNNQVRSMY